MTNCLQNPLFFHRTSPVLNSSPTIRNPIKTSPFLRIPITHLRISSQNHTPMIKGPSSIKISATHLLNSFQHHLSTLKIEPLLGNFTRTRLPLSSLAIFFSAFPASAAEIEQVPDKINLEAIVVAIDDFNNRNPFFVAGLAFIWLAVIPLTQEYLKKFKFVSAIDSFRKLRDVPNSQLLDIRKKQSLNYLSSPNLKILQKNTVQVEFSGVEEEEFVKEVLKYSPDPGNTVLCVLDNFDGDSLVVAELLFKNGFKEAYAIKGGLRGKDGWQAIQEELLPPSMHVYPRKKKSKISANIESSGTEVIKNNSPNGHPRASTSLQQEREHTEVSASEGSRSWQSNHSSA